MKQCTCCHKDKDLDQFPGFVKTYVTVSGEVREYVLRRNKCKACVSKAMVRYQIKDFSFVF